MAQQLRRLGLLNMEVLEDRCVPAVISGFVYNDLNGNGLRDTSEAAIANNTIELWNSSGGLVGTATTDANGFYSFDADASVTTAQQSVVQSITFSDANTNVIRSQPFNQFNNALGSLQSVEIRVNGRIVSTIRLENLDDVAAAVTGVVSGNLLLSGPGFNLNVNTAGNAAISQNLGAYDGVTDYAGRSGTTLSNRSATGTATQTITGSGMSSFIGTGTIDLSFLAQATTQASGGGDLMASIANLGGASVTITYNYVKDNALKPGIYKIVQKNQPLGFLDGRDSQSGSIVANSFNTDALFVTLGNGDSVNNNFGEYLPATISGYVYHDANNNGQRENTEKVFANITVSLTGINDKGQSVTMTALTNAQGQYSFGNLRPGQYSITQKNQPKGYSAGLLTIGSQGGNQDTVTRGFSSIGLVVGANGSDYNFGQLAPVPPSSSGVGVGKGNLLVSLNPNPQPPSPVVVVPPRPASVGKGSLLVPVSGAPQPPSSTPAVPPQPASVGKGNLLTGVTTTPRPPSPITPPAPVRPAVVGKGNLLTSTTPQPPAAVVVPPRPAVVGKSSLLVTRK